MGLMSMFPGGGSTNNQPLKAPTNFVATADGQTSIALTWTDPENEYAQPSGVLIGEWMFTRIVRKTGSAPVNANDGILVVESGVKNQYQTTPYVDTGLISGTVYYYAAFAFTKTRVSSPGTRTSYHLKGYDAVLNNNTWDLIALALSNGDAASIWTKGDTKDTLINGYTFTFELLDFNPNIPLADGSGTPAGFFGMKHLAYAKSTFASKSWQTSGYNEGMIGSVDNPSYLSDEAILGPTINSYYSSLEENLKNAIKQVSFTTNEYKYNRSNNAWGFFSLTVPLYLVPMGTKYHTTSASRKRRLNNGSGDISSWWCGEGNVLSYSYQRESGYPYEYYIGSSFATDSGTIRGEGRYGYSSELPSPMSSKGYAFGFYLGKAVTS